MVNLSRRNFLLLTLAAPLVAMRNSYGRVVTVNGLVSAERLGKTLAHEHVLVDFIGADKIDQDRWDKVDVVNSVAPFFAEAKAYGVKTVVECTPAFLGRDARLLKMLSDKTGMQIITNTGYYGAVNNKYLPPWAFTESAEQLAQRWTDDFDYGIDGSNIRPGFIKISVDAPAAGLSDLHKKLVHAAALTHLKTGLTIYSHTGPAHAAFEQLEILRAHKVSPSAFVWVHAQAEKDKSQYERAAKMGAWVSLDGITGEFDDYVDSLSRLKSARLLKKVLISHDSGYYRPGEKDGGEIKGYTAIFKELIPRLKTKGFDKGDIKRLLVKNPSDALAFSVRQLK
jgi:phosphotriesterase-related protein